MAAARQVEPKAPAASVGWRRSPESRGSRFSRCDPIVSHLVIQTCETIFKKSDNRAGRVKHPTGHGIQTKPSQLGIGKIMSPFFGISVWNLLKTVLIYHGHCAPLTHCPPTSGVRE